MTPWARNLISNSWINVYVTSAKNIAQKQTTLDRVSAWQGGPKSGKNLQIWKSNSFVFFF